MIINIKKIVVELLEILIGFYLKNKAKKTNSYLYFIIDSNAR